MPKPNPNRNISRAEQPASEERSAYGGWLVRFQRNGKQHQHFFGDVSHGGKRKALDAARAKRDELEATLGTNLPSIRNVTRITARNTSGVTGVRWARRVITRGKKSYKFLFATASWTTDPVTHERGTAVFSALKYGKQNAWELALEARAEGVRGYKRALKAMAQSAAK